MRAIGTGLGRAARALGGEGIEVLARERIATFGQPEDLGSLNSYGLSDVADIGSRSLAGVRLHRIGGLHGVGAIADRLGPVSGVVLEHGDQRIYVAGDTIRCAAVDACMRCHAPTTVILNAGGARFVEGDPITMSARDVVGFASEHPSATVIAVHMDAMNHCIDTRTVLRTQIARTGVRNVRVPADGARVHLSD